MFAKNIIWDIDEEFAGDLPDEIEIPKCMTEHEEISDYLM